MEKTELDIFQISNYLIYEAQKKMYLFNKITKKAYSVKYEEFKMLIYLTKLRKYNDVLLNFTDAYTEEQIFHILKKFKEIGIFEYKKEKRKKYGIEINLYINNFNGCLTGIKKTAINLLILFFPILLLTISFNLNSNFTFIQLENDLNHSNIYHNVILFMSCIFAILCHEFGHAVVGTTMKAFVPEISIYSTFFLLRAYTIIIGIDNIQNYTNRVYIYLAGSTMNVFLLSVGLILYKYNNLFYVLILPNLILTIINISVLFKTDGHKIISLFFKKECVLIIRKICFGMTLILLFINYLTSIYVIKSVFLYIIVFFVLQGIISILLISFVYFKSLIMGS